MGGGIHEGHRPPRLHNRLIGQGAEPTALAHGLTAGRQPQQGIRELAPQTGFLAAAMDHRLGRNPAACHGLLEGNHPGTTDHSCPAGAHNGASHHQSQPGQDQTRQRARAGERSWLLNGLHGGSHPCFLGP